jgi:hypothetical protein
MEFDSVKKVAAEFALDRVINFIARDPEHNLPLLFNFVEKVALDPGHKSAVKRIKTHIQGNGQIMEQTKRIARNPKMLHNLINSWIINGFFIGNEKRKKISRDVGVSVPQFLLIDPTSACNLRCEGCWAGEYSKVDHSGTGII